MKNINAEIEILTLKGEARNEAETNRLNALNEFVNIVRNSDSFTQELVNEVVNERHQGVNIYSELDKTKDCYKDTPKNREKYGDRTFNRVIEKKNTIGTVNYIYENSVNNQQDRENLTSDFVSQPRTWGTRICPAIVIHKGELYLTLKFGSTKNVIRENENGSVIPSHIFDNWQLASKKNSYLTAKAQERQGIENVVIPNDFKFANISSIKINNRTLTR